MTDSNETHARLIAAFPLPCILVDPTERVVAANSGACRLFGQDLVGRHLITAIRQPPVLDALESVFRDSEPRQARYLGRDSRRDTTFRVSLSPAPTAKGTGVLLSFEDLTDIEDAGQMRRDFVANVSHELKTPLTALIGFLETLQGAARNDPRAQERFLSIMDRETRRMSQLVNDLLSLSRVEENERVRPVEPVCLSDLIPSTVQALAPVATTANVTIEQVLPAEPVSIPGDENQLRQVLVNLIENAIKYGGAGQKVTVSLTGPDDFALLRGKGVCLTVRDYGDGIPSHHIPRLTERFYRVDSHRSREVGGTGLGLAIVKHITNRHKGRLRIESEQGEGTAFAIYFPIN